MRIIAIIVNLIQMGIILTVFLIQGTTMDGSTILIYFLLLLFAFINLLVLLFYAVNAPINPPLFGEEKPGIVKRHDIRVAYRKTPRPLMIIGDQKVPLLDLAENGARFSIARNQRINRRLRGEIALLCGRAVKFRGRLVRREGDEATIVFKTPLAQETLLMEQRITRNA